MRKTFTLTILSILLSSSFIFAQSKVTRYCQVLTEIKNVKHDKITIQVSLGVKDEYFTFKDSTVIQQLNKVNELKTAADLLNYMSTNGWEIINIITQPGSGYGWRDYYFKKEFDKSDFQ
jgi:hypothetical protein